MPFANPFKSSSTDSADKPRQSFTWVLPKQVSSHAPPGIWTNADLDPTPAVDRTWTATTWILYWVSDIVSVTGWQKASSIISLGLNAKNAIGIVILGAALVAIPTVLNGKIGSKYHIPFPIAMRSSFGYYFAYFAVVIRLILALFWFGIQGWNGGAAVKVLMIALIPSFGNLKNHVPASAGFTTQSMLAYFIYWCLQFPILFIHPKRLQPLFIYKGVATLIVACGTMGWCVHKAGGGGALLSAPSTATGTNFTAAWLTALTALGGGYSTIAVNIPDFTRYAKTPMGQWIQAPILPVLYLITALFGIISASATQQFHGSVLWSPLDIASLWPSRAARVFCAGTWLVAQISNNCSANSISAANDLSTLLPKFVNIRRGQIICAFVGGFCMVPWKVLSSAKVFFNFISSWTIILGPFAGIMVADFILIKREKLDVPALYRPNGIYGNFNWRALVTLILTVTPNLPGMIHGLNANVNIGGIIWVYRLSWVFGFVTALVVHYLINKMFPHKAGLISEPVYASFGDNHNLSLDDESIEGHSESEKEKEDPVNTHVTSVV